MRNPRLANLAVVGSCVRGRGEHSLTPYNPITPGGLDVGLLGSTRVIVKTQTSIEYGGPPVGPASKLGIVGENPTFRIVAVASNAPGIDDAMIVVPTLPRSPGVSAAFGDLRLGFGVGGAPQDGDGLGHECEGDAPLDGFFDPVLGFADAGDVFPDVEADFDGGRTN